VLLSDMALDMYRPGPVCAVGRVSEMMDCIADWRWDAWHIRHTSFQFTIAQSRSEYLYGRIFPHSPSDTLDLNID
jgi:hypothetical protein